jgi:hypothetical protein
MPSVAQPTTQGAKNEEWRERYMPEPYASVDDSNQQRLRAAAMRAATHLTGYKLLLLLLFFTYPKNNLLLLLPSYLKQHAAAAAAAAAGTLSCNKN